MQQLFANKRNHVMILSLWFVLLLVGCCFFNYLELHVGRFVFFFCSTVSSFFREFLNVLFAYLSLSDNSHAYCYFLLLWPFFCVQIECFAFLGAHLRKLENNNIGDVWID